MKRVYVIPVWLVDFLTARGKPVTEVLDQNGLASILSGPDVKSYLAAQSVFGLRLPTNPLASLVSEEAEDYLLSVAYQTAPELFYGLGRPNGMNKSAKETLFYRALVGGGSYETGPTAESEVQLLDFGVESHQDALFVIARRANVSILDPEIRAAILDRAIGALRVDTPLHEIAVTELFSLWLRETQLAKG